VRVDLAAGQRAGILSQPSFLSGFSEGEETDPIRRGKFIVESLLCRAIPAVNLGSVPPLPERPGATMRERLALHLTAGPTCVACHSVLDPPGLALEAYDHVGRHRTTDKTKTLDLRGEFSGYGPGTDGAFNGPIELTRKLAASPLFEPCLVRHAFRFWFGRGETEADACALAGGYDAMKKAGDPLETVLAFVTSDTFLYRTAAK
jgi:hypothetical protein